MAKQAGQLLINRMQLVLTIGAIDIDTGLCQVNLGMAPDPTLAQRTMIEILPPSDAWSGVVPSDPTYDNTTNTVHVVLTASAGTTVNVCFWAPHTLVGPVSVDSYVIPGP